MNLHKSCGEDFALLAFLIQKTTEECELFFGWQKYQKMVKILEAAWLSQLFLSLTFGQLLQHGFLSDTQNMGM